LPEYFLPHGKRGVLPSFIVVQPADEYAEPVEVGLEVHELLVDEESELVNEYQQGTQLDT